ncbi:hypothetical protein Pan97_50500 [Bremerella volcania]|uniref:Uncharacterized protein n=1 Tax=Bremerella volcania TaxID=2527984 RepID=A0A518CFH7_9BACT|nr:hypothetical protein Pan97_50500 [Bremerella volcania]
MTFELPLNSQPSRIMAMKGTSGDNGFFGRARYANIGGDAQKVVFQGDIGIHAESTGERPWFAHTRLADYRGDMRSVGVPLCPVWHPVQKCVKPGRAPL